MARTKPVHTKESVYSDYLTLDLQEKVDLFKSIEADLKESANNLKKEVHLREESIDLLSSVIEIKEK